MDEQTESQLQDAILYLRLGQPEQAYKITSTLFEQALESEEVIYTNRCCVFWIDSRKRLEQIADPYVRSENTLNEWKSFKDFITRETKVYEPAFYAVKKGFFTNALNSFSELLDCSDSLQKAEMYRRTGICYKKLGDFENLYVFYVDIMGMKTIMYRSFSKSTIFTRTTHCKFIHICFT